MESATKAIDGLVGAFVHVVVGAGMQLYKQGLAARRRAYNGLFYSVLGSCSFGFVRHRHTGHQYEVSVDLTGNVIVEQMPLYRWIHHMLVPTPRWHYEQAAGGAGLFFPLRTYYRIGPGTGISGSVAPSFAFLDVHWPVLAFSNAAHGYISLQLDPEQASGHPIVGSIPATGAWAVLFTEIGFYDVNVAGMPAQPVWVALSLVCLVAVLRHKQLICRNLPGPQAFTLDLSLGGGFRYVPLPDPNSAGSNIPILEDVGPNEWQKWWADMVAEVQVMLV